MLPVKTKYAIYTVFSAAARVQKSGPCSICDGPLVLLGLKGYNDTAIACVHGAYAAHVKEFDFGRGVFFAYFVAQKFGTVKAVTVGNVKA